MGFDENGHGDDVMEEQRSSPTLDRGERFFSCWQELAATEAEVAEIDDQALKDEVGAGDGVVAGAWQTRRSLRSAPRSDLSPASRQSE